MPDLAPATSDLTSLPLADAASVNALRWQAVTQRDAKADGSFYYAVRTTGVVCRPSCPSRHARRENVLFYDTYNAALQAGYRPCKRCKPDQEGIAERQGQAVAYACQVIEHAANLPSLETLAELVGMSRYHFHRLFKAHMGITPKAYASAHRANKLRVQLAHGVTVTEAMYDAGFQSSGGFYATSSQLLGMTPGAYRSGGSGLQIRFGVGQCWLGAILVAATEHGICAITLGDDPVQLVRELQDRFAKAELIGGDARFEQWMATVIGVIEVHENSAAAQMLPLDVRGTAFQQQVWQALRAIPIGVRISYSELAQRIGQPAAVRAVASACAANTIAVLIPCHRVVRTDGSLSGYRWGVERKKALLQRENTAPGSKDD
ncbi:AraC family transcriptional regulator of adaptative response/methylated-DNA-[protein]-cysteine methyltransferase [Herbaspirillum sp. Sphag1AN]|uniref:bifunctional DNA-binding transcriptional regulator/O6-methylguanine-DNA methyltransferase Ada n=1 Tax=unclassified Herbaspirillum TaxID=2624150 RepID=UPI00160D84A3|nr:MULTISPECIES: bifunctional DNA-binding transcriptional regulator/O6-methylguanine-DNA methyltransferase Ada [unclassified Herbaspirillum]MBB3212030.1 AraC family transcriptional regulator of adaptative response/methylated-DNA-[protein]-cysteine methyltransferase [Herbaspirillum sp. Sphag1AN]MBB3244136.1 AraC family transcriptional regulator of adaptative response/methylated-DNA-[protein]-cysteine methyltransferase [Herbaspirillum sp. Sphag64]